MARYPDQSSKTVIKNWRKEGRGLGHGANYKPWLNPWDISSHGYSTHGRGQTTGRVHSLLSKHERHFLYIMDWCERVNDIREQFPLDLEKTVKIAQLLGVVHPGNPRTGQPHIVTTDFLVTLMSGQNEAFAIKPKGNLNKRTLEKLAIEEAYWTLLGVTWKIVTEDEIPVVFARNVDWICDVQDFKDYAISPELTAAIARTLWPDIITQSTPLRDLTDEVDRVNAHELGTPPLVVRQMLARRVWLVNMFKRIDPTEILCLVEPAETGGSLAL